MEVKVLINGQKQTIAVPKDSIRLELETKGVAGIKGVDYFVFEQDKTFAPIFQCSSTSGTTYIQSGLLKDCTEYQCVAVVHFDNLKDIRVQTQFETAISYETFTANWIDNPIHNEYVSEFEQEFDIDETIEKGRLYIVGLGFYQSSINGRRTDDDFYKPLLTDFDVRTGLNHIEYDEEAFKDGDKTICYGTYDITHMLQQGKNRLSVLVGTGWYCNTDKTITDPSYSFGTPKLIFEIHLYNNKNKQVIVSGTNCLVRSIPIKSQLFHGDYVDFTGSSTEFVHANLCEIPKGRLIPSEVAFDKIQERIKPVQVRHLDEIEEYALGKGKTGETVKNKRSQETLEYDFGKNHTGGVHLKVKGERGSRLTLRFYEVKTNGILNAETSSCGLWDRKAEMYIGAIKQCSEYILSGEVDEIYPLFHWDCYRYVTLECSEKLPEIIEIESLFICSDVKKDGGFGCSESFLNRLYKAFILTQKDNMHCGVPSDCPHREKLPYTGDGQLAMEAVLYCFDSENFYRKWLKDIIAAQRNDGWVPYTAPYIAGGGGSWWSNALIMVSMRLYRYTGDKEILRAVLQPALKLLEFYNNSHDGNYIITKGAVSWLLGDWLTPDFTVFNAPYMNTLACYDAICQTLEICDVLGEEEPKIQLLEFKQKIKDAINHTFFDKANMNYCQGVQGENILPIINGIAENDIADTLWKKTVEHYRKKPHLDTGIIMTPILLETLVQKGEKALAYEIFTSKTAPSYYSMLRGETTLIEHFRGHWQGKDGSQGGHVSHCHPMFGSVISWMVRHIAGLDISELYAKRITIAPKFINQVKEAHAYKHTRFGKVSVKYRAEDNFSMQLQIPYGCTAQVILPSEIVGKGVCLRERKGDMLKWSESETGYWAFVTGGSYTIS